MRDDVTLSHRGQRVQPTAVGELAFEFGRPRGGHAAERFLGNLHGFLLFEVHRPGFHWRQAVERLATAAE